MPVNATWNCLAESRNEAATATLVTGLTFHNGSLRQRCIAALIRRKDPSAHPEIIRNWSGLDEKDIELLSADSKRLSAAAVNMLKSGEVHEKRLALDAIAALRLSASMEAVLEIVLDSKHAQRAQAIECLHSICNQLGTQARSGKRTNRARIQLLEILNYQMELFHEHECEPLIDAWLNLVHWDDVPQRRLLANSRHVAYDVTLQRMKESEMPCVFDLLSGYLSRGRNSPPHVTEILVQRDDLQLAERIARSLTKESMAGVLSCLRRLPPLGCLKDIRPHITELDADLRPKMWLLISASSEDFGLVLDGSLLMGAHADPESRSIAAAMIRGCRRPSMEDLVAEIQTARNQVATKPSVGRELVKLANWATSDSHLMRNAAKQLFADFTIDALLDAIRIWPAQMCKAMARIVERVETDYYARISRELQSPAPKRRLAALQVTHLLDASEHVIGELLPLLEDPRMEVRVRVIDLLGALGHEALEEQLPKLLADTSTDIQDAANRAKRRFERLARRG